MTPIMLRASLSIAAVTALLLAPVQAAPPDSSNLIVNGSFESPAISGWTILSAIPGWSASACGIEIQNHLAGSPADGNQLVELDAYCSSFLAQDVPTIPGQKYVLTFAYSPRPGVEDNGLAVRANGNDIASINQSGVGLDDTSWTYVSRVLVATGLTTRIEFADASVSDAYGTYIDDITFAPPPGPSIAADAPGVNAPAGSEATMTGTYVALDGTANVNVTASIGTVSQTGPYGTWRWSHVVPPDAHCTVVAVAATDSSGAMGSTTFTVNHAAPALMDLVDQQAAAVASHIFSLGSLSQGSNCGPWSVNVNWGDGTANTVFAWSRTDSLGTAPHTYNVTGTRTVTVTVTDALGTVGSGSFEVAIAPPAITLSPTLPDGVANTPYSYPLVATGGAAPYLFMTSAGFLPVGLTLSSSGIISGTPTQVGPSAFTVRAWYSFGFMVTRSYSFSIAMPRAGLANGQAWGWGHPIGTVGTIANLYSPVQLANVSGITQVSAGEFFSLALKADGSVWAWGAATAGEIGNGTFGVPELAPVQVGVSGVTAVSAGTKHSIALTTGGEVWAWGLGSSGQLGYGGIGTGRCRCRAPIQVVGLTGVSEVAGGGAHSLALKADGTIWSWGRGTSGQMGNGSYATSPAPVEVIMPAGVTFLTGIAAIAAGDAHSLALDDDGRVWAWGAGSSGQIGDGVGANRSTPVPVVGPSGGFVGIAAGGAHSLGLARDGSVWAWGAGADGQLGHGGITDSWTPIQVVDAAGTGFLSDVITIASGSASHSSLALKRDGTIWAWGRNSHGQLGDGTATNSAMPVQVAALRGVTAIAAGASHTLALTGASPIVTAAGHQHVVAGTPLSIAPGSFSDTNSGPWTVTVEWADGSAVTNFDETVAGSLTSQSHSYAEPGFYAPKITVTNNIGLSGEATLAITALRGTHVHVSPATMTYGGPLTLEATLTGSGIGLPNRSVTFHVWGAPVGHAITNASGTARLMLADVPLDAGFYPGATAAAFAGGEWDAPSAGSGDLSILKANQTITTTAPAYALTGGVIPVTTSAPGGPVSVSVDGPCLVTSSAITAGPETGSCTLSFNQAGNGNYNPAAVTREVLVYGTAGTGTFVIGDKAHAAAVAGQSTVTFWGAQWSALNAMSGATSAGAQSFKGFASSVHNSGWASRGGNSSNPPATLPTYLALAVTSTVTKSGSAISGNVVKTVIVKVDPGYGGNPGHAGRGMIVATLP